MSTRTRHRWSFVRVALIALNIMATYGTIFTGFRENRLLAVVTGRYDIIRNRLRYGSINTEILEPDQYRLQDLATPTELAEYTLLRTPTRSTKNFGQDVSVCANVNTNAGPVQLSNYDDFWGKGPRRVQTYTYSISAPNCKILNVKPAWRDQCVARRHGNATACYEYILTHFENLQKNRSIRMLSERDLGAPGVLFLRCATRPLEPFTFYADRLAHQAYWNGGDYHVSIQTSTCKTTPLVQSGDLHDSLFQAYSVDDSAKMMILLPDSGWFANIVPWAYSLVTLTLIGQGVTLTLFHTRFTSYLPNGLRVMNDQAWRRLLLPFMEMTTKFSNNDRSVIRFKGSLVVASDFWMTHWLYMWVSIIDAVVNIRATYVTFQIATALLTVRTTMESLIFLSFAVAKIAWIMCLIQTVLRGVLRLGVRLLRALRVITMRTRENLEWHVDSLFMFQSYRIYNGLLFGIVMILLQVNGTPSFMVRQTPYRVPVYGGPIDIAGFWGSEVACDLVSLLALLTGVSWLFGLVMLWTKYRYVANNGVMRLLQQRYMICGWDGLLAADLLGLDPYVEGVVVDGRAYTQFPLGSLLQLLYLSGPSGFVHLAGDYIFHDNGFSKDPVKFAYPIPKAIDMGLFGVGKGSALSSSFPIASGDDGASQERTHTIPVRAKQLTASKLTAKTSIFERRLRLVSDGYFGKLLFVDSTHPTQITVNQETGQRECEVVDALTTMSILDIKHLMGRDKMIHVQ